MKRSSWSCVFSVILVPATSQVVVSLPQPPVLQYPEVRVGSEDSPYCYIQLTEGQLLNLEELCRRTSAGRADLSTDPPKPSNRSRLSDKPSSFKLFPSGRSRVDD